MGVSNLECFLNRSTPVLQARFQPKKSRTDEQLPTINMVEYFNLGDLWDFFDEWSAYGLGSPIVLSQRETVVQYYTPYLSAIQIYIAKSESSRDFGGYFEAESEIKSWSSESDDGELSRSNSSTSDKTWDLEDMGVGLETSWSASDRFGELYFEHFEYDGPFGRVPLKEKVDALGCKYQGLRSLNSVDLSPASWVAIAWYPIYHIPSTRNAKKLYASFLTYHSLSSVQDGTSYDVVKGASCSLEVGKEKVKHQFGHGRIRLHPFGLATYRMQPRIWLDDEGTDHGRISSLMAAANSWLRQLQVQHHDYNFFVSHPG